MNKVLLIGLLLSSSLAFGQSGRIGSGGGSGVRVDGKTILLDLYAYTKDRSLDQWSPSVPLPNTKAFSILGIERINLNNSELGKKILSRLDIWAESSPEIIDSLRQAFLGVPLYYTNYRIGKKFGEQYIPEHIKVNLKDLIDIAFYEKNFGILISKREFDSLDNNSQVGLIIHELLRHLQIQYGYEMSNRSLQLLTAKLVVDEPSFRETLDAAPYLDGKILETLKRKSTVPSLYQNAIQKIAALKEKYGFTLANINLPNGQDSKISSDNIFDLADLYLNTAYALVKFKRDNPSMADEEYNQINEEEMDLRYSSDRIRAGGIGALVDSASRNTHSLQDTVLAAKTSPLDTAIEEANASSAREISSLGLALQVGMESLVKRGILIK